MPSWVMVVVSTAAVLTAIGVIWVKAVRPVWKFIQLLVDLHPILLSLITAFKDEPDAFGILKEIQNEFKSNHGTSLRDIVNNLEEAAIESQECGTTLKTSISDLKVAIEATRYALAADRQLAIQDREKALEVLLRLDRLTVKVDDRGVRSEEIAQRAGADAKALQMEAVQNRRRDAVVAGNLDAAQQRAGQVQSMEPGAAADVAAIPPPEKLSMETALEPEKKETALNAFKRTSGTMKKLEP